ncbi:MAG TPA: diadenylate cyclase CdaA [Dehalococcoidia bacterium]|nr:diadenylate cyclase CdaA [Dehalococcoidia bacterium]
MQQFFSDIWDTLQRLDGPAVLDILIIASIIFALLMALRGTTAMTLLRGAVVIVCALFLIGRLLDLSVVNFILRNSLPGLVLGAIVIFQPEIRRTLERAGRTSIRRLLIHSADDVALDEIAAAVTNLARQRHGAIIVIERSTGLEDLIETGVHLDAELDARLLESIFFPNSPLHDKAVIIRGKRIVAASCTLPLSSGAGAGRMGTRHRAGLGVSEETDAVAVVVSEETGSISIASEGRLIPLRDETRLRSTLEALVLARRGPSREGRPAAQVS